MLWVKSLHIFFVISWFAGIFYLPRIFVNQAMTENPAVYQHLSEMAGRLYRFITPFMILTLVFGVWLVWYNLDYYLQSGWFHAKILLVLLLVGYHFLCGYYHRQLSQNRCHKSHRFFRIFNEVPVFFLIGIIILVMVRPF